jgi:hypothetical protein
MELIKKQFELITTTASTTCDEGVEGPCYRIIPDTTVNYNIKVLLTARDIDFGFFDLLEQSPYYVLYPYGVGYGCEWVQNEDLAIGLSNLT